MAEPSVVLWQREADDEQRAERRFTEREGGADREAFAEIVETDSDGNEKQPAPEPALATALTSRPQPAARTPSMPRYAPTRREHGEPHSLIRGRHSRGGSSASLVVSTEAGTRAGRSSARARSRDLRAKPTDRAETTGARWRPGSRRRHTPISASVTESRRRRSRRGDGRPQSCDRT